MGNLHLNRGCFNTKSWSKSSMTWMIWGAPILGYLNVMGVGKCPVQGILNMTFK
jgi:hypothetical protein